MEATMDRRSDPTLATSASLTAARAHVLSLSSSDREVLLRALLEPMGLQPSQQQPDAQKLDSPTTQEKNDDPTRLSVSTTASTTSTASSTGNASYVSALSSPSASDSSAPAAAAAARPTSHSSTAPSTRAYWCLSCGKKQSSRTEWKQHDGEHHQQHHHHSRTRGTRRRSGSASGLGSPMTKSPPPTGQRKRAWGCGFCAAFLGSLDRFQDHVALHFESGKTLAHWHHENVIYGLLHQPSVHEAWKALQAARYAAVPRAQRPKMGWDVARTGRGDGQLQSLLEYFDPARHNAWDVARLADELAIRITLSVVPEPEEPGSTITTTTTTITIPRLSITAVASPPGATTTGSAQRHSKWASSAAAAGGLASEVQLQQQPRPVASARIISQLPVERPLPQLALENYYDPHPGTRVQIPDFLPVVSEQHHHQSIAVGPAAPRHVFADWDSLASTVVETAAPRNFSLPCPRHWTSTQFLPSGAVA